MGTTQKVVLTGFGPFGCHEENVSWSAVKGVQRMGLGEGVVLVTEQLPVVYEHVKSRIPQLWNEHKPKLVVHVGVADDYTKLIIEHQAFNGSYDRFDVKGALPPTLCCVDGGDNCIQSGINMDQVVADINNHACAATADSSKDPGRYLCDFSYYTSLSIDKQRAAFIHVPCKDNPYSVDELAEGIRVAILSMLQQLS